MIFYFSATGNSKHIAEKISRRTGERLVYICANTLAENETYEIGENEKVGFVFPVYWYCLPTIVERFIRQIKLSGYQKQYIYAIATFGISAGNTMNRLIRILRKKQLQPSGIFGVRMVDNYVLLYDIASADKQNEILNNAETETDKIISMIERRENTEYIKKGKLALFTPLTGYAYRKTDHTRKFHVTQACNGCSKCALGCPCNAIHMENGKPVWAGDCTFCLKCFHGCGQSAVQYGRYTVKRGRYQYRLQ